MAPLGAFHTDFNSKLKIVSDKQVLHINKKNRTIKGIVKAIRFQDKDTKQFVIYVPSHELTGYGSSEKRAMEMLKFSIDDFCSFLLTLSAKKMDEELVKLGWKKDRVKNKEYSKAHVDVDGNLKSFNAVEDKVEFVDIEIAA